MIKIQNVFQDYTFKKVICKLSKNNTYCTNFGDIGKNQDIDT